MTAYWPIPSDFASRTLSLERASQLFPSLGISIIESRERPNVHLGSSIAAWTGKPETILAYCGEVLYDLDCTVEVQVRRGVPIYHRERLYAMALSAAAHGPDHARDNWVVLDDGVLQCGWLGRLEESEVVDQLIDEFRSLDGEAIA